MIELTHSREGHEPDTYRSGTAREMVETLLPGRVVGRLACARLDDMEAWNSPLWEHMEAFSGLLAEYDGPMDVASIMERLDRELAIGKLTDMLRPENIHSDEGAVLTAWDWEITVREVDA